MPANLTPQFQKAEREYRRAQSLMEQVDCLQRMLQLIPKHKGTERLQANLKTRLKEARQQLASNTSAKSGLQFRFPSQGAGRVVVVGPPNCGKSRLVKELTRATPEVSPWPFTTREPMPGMLKCNDVQIQLIDTPPVSEGSMEPWMLNLVRTADAAVLLLDGGSDDGPDLTLAVINQFESRKTRFSTESGFDENDFAVLRIPTLLLITHAADPDSRLRHDMLVEQMNVRLPSMYVEFNHTETIPLLANRIYELLNLIRVYTRKPREETDLRDPITLPCGGTVEDLALHLHEDLFHRLSHARIRRIGSPDFQTVGRQHKLNDGDVVELHG